MILINFNLFNPFYPTLPFQIPISPYFPHHNRERSNHRIDLIIHEFRSFHRANRTVKITPIIHLFTPLNRATSFPSTVFLDFIFPCCWKRRKPPVGTRGISFSFFFFRAHASDFMPRRVSSRHKRGERTKGKEKKIAEGGKVKGPPDEIDPLD